MLKIAFFITIITIFVFVDLIPALRRRNIRYAAAFLAFSCLALSICILTELGVKIPSPAKPIKTAVDALLRR
ncbi:MAG TPA: hypothetical protein DD727_06850 [Clostridiales bacterium]|nr:hypothetical protein [Clostridiales bacterium]